MNREFYHNLADTSLAQKQLEREVAERILTSNEIELLPLLTAAYEVRKKFTGKEVMIHIINNSQNGYCPEDCHYCAQAKTSKSGIAEYALKSDSEFLHEAKKAYESGAHRYCMVFAGKGPSTRRVEHLANLIKMIKSKYPLEICVSAGLLDREKAKVLKDAGLDRLNHNLNTSEEHYPKICTTHTYRERIETLLAAREAGLQLCSGLIVGMGEMTKDVIDVAYKLREIAAESIPVNYLIPIPGNQLETPTGLTPEYCLRVLCLYRFVNPQAEIRVAAGREVHFGSMEVMSLYAANSLFLEGYLNARGAEVHRTLKMIQEAGFTIKSEYPLEDLLSQKVKEPIGESETPIMLKEVSELRPGLQDRSIAR